MRLFPARIWDLAVVGFCELPTGMLCSAVRAALVVEPRSQIDFTGITAIGATSPLPRVPATVLSRSDLQTFTTVPCKPAVCWVGDLRPGKPPEGKLDGGESNEGAQAR